MVSRYFLSDEIPEMLRRDGLERGVGVCLRERAGRTGLRRCLPFEIERVEHPVHVLHQVDLVLRPCPPEVRLRVIPPVGIPLHALAYHQVLPQGSHVRPQLDGSEMINDGIANAVIVKIHLLPLLDFVPWIAAERIQPSGIRDCHAYCPGRKG